MGRAGSTRLADARTSASRGFTLIDLLVSIFVIAILIGLMLPSLSKATESARRVACQSNVRQIGLGLVMYADDSKGHLPPSVFLLNDPSRRIEPKPSEMVTLRVGAGSPPLGSVSAWDGLGVLFAADYLPAPKLFYCPSHRGDHPFSKYAKGWGRDGGEVISNYHFRGEGPVSRNPADRYRRTQNLYLIDPAQSSLIADGMRERADYNHRVGANYFRADLTVHWYADRSGEVSDLLPLNKEDNDASIIADLWARFDARANGED